MLRATFYIFNWGMKEDRYFTSSTSNCFFISKRKHSYTHTFLPLYWACDKTLQLNSQGFSHFNSSPLNGYLAFITCQNASVFTCSINSTSSTWKANNNKHVQWLCYLSKPLCMLNKGMVVINLCLEVGRPGPITWGQYGGEDHACPVISWHSYGSNWLAQPSDKERPDGSTDRGKLERMF